MGDMPSFWSKLLSCALVGLGAAQCLSSSSSRSCNVTQIEGCNATGEIKKVDGGQWSTCLDSNCKIVYKLTREVDIYHAYPRNQSSKDDEKNTSTAVLFLTDFYGIASINNKL